MATVLDFAKIAKINGVMQFLLVRRDGQVMTHNMSQSESLAGLVLEMGLSAEKQVDRSQAKRFDHATVHQSNNQNFHVFPAGNYFVGIMQDPDAFTPDFITSVNRFLTQVLSGTKKTKGRTTYVTPLD